MSSKKPLSVSIQPLNYVDIPACAQITSSAFAADPHTVVKQLGPEPFDMYKISSSGFCSTLSNKTYVYVKAMDNETGEIVGHAGWKFRGLNEELVPWSGPSDEKPRKEEQKMKNESGDNKKKEDEARKEEGSIDRLHALEGRDMNYWLSSIVPPDTPCIFIVGLIVSPSYQSRGVGSGLLRYGNNIADKLGLCTWVHSSHQAYEAYKKFGFDAVRDLDIDLDEYAPRGPREGEPVMGDKGRGGWGRYVIRYMKRIPKKLNGSDI
ncbi:acyl-CoA N-acyltransferase [Xylaria flabelliformis]|nr:acyl-CoA N-acyltransferase [Xylaria flabelliformis]